MAVIIYGLFDPRTGKCHYVGQTRRKPDDRLAQHLAGHIVENQAKYLWIKELRSVCLLPRIETIEIVEGDDAVSREQAWILRMRTEGHPLTNLLSSKLASSLDPELDALKLIADALMDHIDDFSRQVAKTIGGAKRIDKLLKARWIVQAIKADVDEIKVERENQNRRNFG